MFDSAPIRAEIKLRSWQLAIARQRAGHRGTLDSAANWGGGSVVARVAGSCVEVETRNLK
jgi:hypothetical protein